MTMNSKSIYKAGEMLYCYNEGRTSCCYINEKCSENWDEINDDMTKKAVGFMMNPQSFLTNLVQNAGYDTCHRIKGYDVEQCHQDCQKLEKSNFAESCRKDGGFYKCCIRYMVYQYIFHTYNIYISINQSNNLFTIYIYIFISIFLQILN